MQARNGRVFPGVALCPHVGDASSGFMVARVSTSTHQCCKNVTLLVLLILGRLWSPRTGRLVVGMQPEHPAQRWPSGTGQREEPALVNGSSWRLACPRGPHVRMAPAVLGHDVTGSFAGVSRSHLEIVIIPLQ